MRERAEQLGGAATIRSAPGEGTSIMVVISLEKEQAEAATLAVLQEEASHE